MHLKHLILISLIKAINTDLVQIQDLDGMGGIDVEYESAFDQELYASVLDPVKCEEQLEFLRTNDSIRALFTDATGKIPTGITIGNLADFGSYHQCLTLRHQADDMEIEGKYCMLQVPLDQIMGSETEDPGENTNIDNLWPQIDNETMNGIKQFKFIQRQVELVSGARRPMESTSRVLPAKFASALKMSLGTCIPKVCRPRQVIDYVLTRNIPGVNLTYEEFFCRLPDDKPLSIADYLAIGIFSLIIFITIISTSYELYMLFGLRKETSQINTLYRCFSVYTNTKRFLTFNAVPGALECVDGIRAISMLWVIFGHSYCLTMLTFVFNIKDVMNWLTSFTSIWINSAPITVDTFFMLSGILCVYTVIGKISRWKFIKSIHFFYLYRLLRIFPLLATVILLQASLFHRMSDGPMWLNMGHVTSMCRSRWWSALLHIQNYVKPIGVCLYQTWYLSVDIQLYIISPAVLVFLFGGAGVAWCALTSAVLISLVLSTTYSFIYNYSAALANPSRVSEFSNYFVDYYMNTLTRAPPFFVGMMYGYLLYKCKGKKIRIRMILVFTLWVLAFALMAFCIFSTYPIMQIDHDDQMFDNFLNAYMRGIWAVAMGWLIFACVHGYGGPINWFLSLEMWKLPARLSYAMYLLHYPIIMVANGSMTTTYYFTDLNTLYRAMGDLTFTTIAALILSITIDAPFSTIQKLLLGGKKKKDKKVHAMETQADGVEENNKNGQAS